MTLTHLIDSWPAWTALAVSGLVWLNRMIDESAKFAKALGGWATKRHARAQMRHKLDLAAAEFAQAIQDAVEKARKGWESDENAALRALDERLGQLSDLTQQQQQDIEEMRFQLRAMTSYTEYEAAWHHRFNIAIMRGEAVADILKNIPVHMDYFEFERQYRKDSNIRAWWGLK